MLAVGLQGAVALVNANGPELDQLVVGHGPRHGAERLGRLCPDVVDVRGAVLLAALDARDAAGVVLALED